MAFFGSLSKPRRTRFCLYQGRRYHRSIVQQCSYNIDHTIDIHKHHEVLSHPECAIDARETLEVDGESQI